MAVTSPLEPESLCQVLARTPNPELKVRILLEYIEAHGGILKVFPPENEEIDLRGIDLRPGSIVRLFGNPAGRCWWNDTYGVVDLSNAVLDRPDLRAAILEDTLISHAQLNGAVLANTSFNRSVLNDCEMQNAIIIRTTFRQAQCVNTDFRNSKILGVDFSYADLQDAIFRESHITDTDFIGEPFGPEGTQITLFGADFRGSNILRVSFNGANLLKTKFQEAELYKVSFRNAHLQYTGFQGVHLGDADLYGAFLCEAILDGTRFTKEQLHSTTGEELLARKPMNDPSALQILASLQEPEIGPVRITDSEKQLWFHNAQRAYLALKQNFEGLGDYNTSSWAYIKERDMRKWGTIHEARLHKVSKQYWRAFLKYVSVANSYLQEWICNYGESGWRVFATLIVLLLSFAALYWFINGAMDSAGSITHNPVELVIFSLGNMTTLDLGFSPACLGSRIASGLQGFFSVLLIGLLGFVMGNRIRRA